MRLHHDLAGLGAPLVEPLDVGLDRVLGLPAGVLPTLVRSMCGSCAEGLSS